MPLEVPPTIQDESAGDPAEPEKEGQLAPVREAVEGPQRRKVCLLKEIIDREMLEHPGAGVAADEAFKGCR